MIDPIIVGLYPALRNFSFANWRNPFLANILIINEDTSASCDRRLRDRLAALVIENVGLTINRYKNLFVIWFTKWLKADSITQSSKSIRLKSNLPAYPKTLVRPVKIVTRNAATVLHRTFATLSFFTTKWRLSVALKGGSMKRGSYKTAGL